MPLPMNTHKMLHLYILYLYDVYFRIFFFYAYMICCTIVYNCTISRIPIIWVLCFRDSINCSNCSILFNNYTVDITSSRASVQVMVFADDIIITYTHTSTSPAKKYIHPYLNKGFAWTKQNNFALNPDKTTCTLFTPDPAEYKSNLSLEINNTTLPMATHPKILGLTLNPKLTYSTHIHNISVQAHKPL